MRDIRLLDERTHYDPRRAVEMAAAALRAYDGPEQAAPLRDGLPGAERLMFQIEATQCELTADYEQMTVSFRGTESNLEDWMGNLDFHLVRGPFDADVHGGFYDALSYVWTLLDGEVRRLLAERPRRLWVTGHSLGGALATLAAARWAAAGVPVSGVYTFGQPRTGDRTFARQYDFLLRDRTFRVVNHLDIVTRTPPRALGFRHVGSLVYLTGNGKAEHHPGWWEQFLTGWCGTIETIFDWCGEGVQDHRMTEYLALLERQAPAAAPTLSLYTPPEPVPANVPRRRAPHRRAA